MSKKKETNASGRLEWTSRGIGMSYEKKGGKGILQFEKTQKISQKRKDEHFAGQAPQNFSRGRKRRRLGRDQRNHPKKEISTDRDPRKKTWFLLKWSYNWP